MIYRLFYVIKVWKQLGLLYLNLYGNFNSRWYVSIMRTFMTFLWHLLTLSTNYFFKSGSMHKTQEFRTYSLIFKGRIQVSLLLYNMYELLIHLYFLVQQKFGSIFLYIFNLLTAFAYLNLYRKFNILNFPLKNCLLDILFS